jgi:hypothetical protein
MVRAELLGKQEQAGSTARAEKKVWRKAEEVVGCGKHHSLGQRKIFMSGRSVQFPILFGPDV